MQTTLPQPSLLITKMDTLLSQFMAQSLIVHQYTNNMQSIEILPKSTSLTGRDVLMTQSIMGVSQPLDWWW